MAINPSYQLCESLHRSTLERDDPRDWRMVKASTGTNVGHRVGRVGVIKRYLHSSPVLNFAICRLARGIRAIEPLSHLTRFNYVDQRELRTVGGINRNSDHHVDVRKGYPTVVLFVPGKSDPRIPVATLSHIEPNET
jgi:hypothetical protein